MISIWVVCERARSPHSPHALPRTGARQRRSPCVPDSRRALLHASQSHSPASTPPAPPSTVRPPAEPPPPMTAAASAPPPGLSGPGDDEGLSVKPSSIPGAGLGLFAERPFQRGETVGDQHPLPLRPTSPPPCRSRLPPLAFVRPTKLLSSLQPCEPIQSRPVIPTLPVYSSGSLATSPGPSGRWAAPKSSLQGGVPLPLPFVSLPCGQVCCYRPVQSAILPTAVAIRLKVSARMLLAHQRAVLASPPP